VSASAHDPAPLASFRRVPGKMRQTAAPVAESVNVKRAIG